MRLTRWTGVRLLLPVLAIALAVGLLAAAAAAPDAAGEGVVRAASTAPPVAQQDDRSSPGRERLSAQSAVGLVRASVRAAQRNRPIPSELSPRVAQLGGDRADLGRCDYDTPSSTWTLCRRGDPDADRTVVVLGHSLGRAWIPAFERFTKRAGYAAYYLVRPRCSPVRMISTYPSGQVRTECAQFNRWAQRQVARIRPDLVTISGTAPHHALVGGRPVSDREVILRGMRSAFTRLVEDVSRVARRVAVVAAAPQRVTEPARCLRAPGARMGDCLERPDPYAVRVIRQSALAARETGARFVNSTRWFCASGWCPAVVGSYVAMRDTLHPTSDYSASLAGPLGRSLGLLPRMRASVE